MATHRDGRIVPHEEHTPRGYGAVARISDKGFKSAYDQVRDDVRLKRIVAAGVDFEDKYRSGFGNDIVRGKSVVGGIVESKSH